MAVTQMFTAIILSLAIIVTVTAASGLRDVCQWETFEAKCQEDEVIMIKEAHYGRLGVGRCQPRDFGFAGCSADVSDIMHAHCSGRHHCSVPVPDPTMFAATPCPKDLVTYLKAEYECVKVAKSHTDNCNDNILTALSGNIAKPLTMPQAHVCPHRILAQPGQIVNVYLSDFYNKDSNTEAISECITYGYMFEGSKTPTKICGGEFKKNQLIYSSDNNVVDITLTETSSHSHHYLLHYEVIGCPTLQAPANAFVKIQDNTAVVMCNFSHIASELVCSGYEWVGEVQNCTTMEDALVMAGPLSISALSDIFSNTSILAVICVGLACLVLFAAGLLALIKAWRLKSKQVSELPQLYTGEKPPLPQHEKSFKPVDQYQPVYVPITMDSRGSYAPMHDAQPNALSTLYAARIPVIENNYGPLSGNRIAPAHTYNHSLYNITGLHLNKDNVIALENSVLS